MHTWHTFYLMGTMLLLIVLEGRAVLIWDCRQWEERWELINQVIWDNNVIQRAMTVFGTIMQQKKKKASRWHLGHPSGKGQVLNFYLRLVESIVFPLVGNAWTLALIRNLLTCQYKRMCRDSCRHDHWRLISVTSKLRSWKRSNFSPPVLPVKRTVS